MRSGLPVEFGLPHREPFVFLQEVLYLDPGQSGRARQTFTGKEDFFRGHFPGEPLVPGVLLTEAIAQLAGMVAGATASGVRFYLTAIKQMKFPEPVGPRQPLDIEVRLLGRMGELWQFEGSVFKVEDGGVVAEGVVVLSGRL